MIPSKKLKEVRERAGLSQVKLAKLCKISRQMLYSYEGGKGNPTLDTLESIATNCGSTIEELFTGHINASDYKEKLPARIRSIERELENLDGAPEPLIDLAETVVKGVVKAARALPAGNNKQEEPVSIDTDNPSDPPDTAQRTTSDPPPDHPPAVKDNIVPFDNNIDEMREVVQVLVPMWDYVAASPPSGNHEDPSFIGYFPVVHSWKKETWRTIQVRGDSMEPDFHDGDIVLVDLAGTPHKGAIVVADIIGEGGTFKKLGSLKGPTVRLIPMNPKYNEMEYPKDKVKIIAVYVETTRARRGK